MELWKKALLLLLPSFLGLLDVARSLELRNGAYEDLVIKIADNVPETDCRNILENLEVSFYAIFVFEVDAGKIARKFILFQKVLMN